MNKTFKVVFNKVRGAFVAVNEATSSVQKKGTKTVLAAAAAMAFAGAACAEDINYSQTENNSGYQSTAENKTREFAADDKLIMNITGAATRAYGLLATGKGTQFTNKGTIELNTATENAAPYYMIKGMMADNGGTAINEGVIDLNNAYGMTVGSTGTNKIVNKGTINVAGSTFAAGMEIAPTGAAGTIPGANAVGENAGTINVTHGVGVLMAGQGSAFTSTGTINAADGTAIYVQAEKGKTTSNNSIALAAGSTTTGDIFIKGGDGNKVSNTVLTIGEGAVFDGSIEVQGATDTKITANTTFKGRSGSFGAAIFLNDPTAQVDLSGSNFIGNVAQAKDKTTGGAGAIYSYAKTLTQKGGSYVNNQALSEGYNNGTIQDGALGGALVIKGNSITMTDVLFQGNSATATKTDKTVGGYAYGGAIAVDYSTGYGDGTGQNRTADLTVNITQDMTYSGNTVSSDSTGTHFDTFGYHVLTAAAGGFLFLDRGSSADFNVSAGATLTIGSTVTTDDTDSIASSIPDAGTKTNSGRDALIKKTGNGTLVLNSSLNKYYGDLQVNAGRMEVNSQWSLKSLVTVEGGTLALAGFNFEQSDAEKRDTEINDGKITVTSGGLETSADQVFTTTTSESNGATTETVSFKYTSNQVSITENGSLVLNDATFTVDEANAWKSAMTTASQRGKLTLLGQLVNNDGTADTEVTIDEVAGLSGDTMMAGTTVVSENKGLVIGGQASEGQVARAESLGVQAVDLGTADSVKVTGGKTLTLVGGGDEVVKTTAEAGAAVTVDGGTLALGGSGTQGGQLSGKVTLSNSGAMTVDQGAFNVSTVEVADGTNVAVSNGGDLSIDELTGSGDIAVGNEKTAGSLSVADAGSFSGWLFFDPAFTGNDTVRTASTGAILTWADTGWVAKAAVGQNSFVSIGADAETGYRAFEAIAVANDLAWGEGKIEAAAYVDKPVVFAKGATVDKTGLIWVDGSMTSQPNPVSITHQVDVAANSLLMVNQANAGEQPYFTNYGESATAVSVNFANGSYLGIVNATEGSFTLAGTVAGAPNVVTDNPFFSGALDTTTGTVTMAFDADGGLAAVASTGLQAMTRRADFTMAQTIADRASTDQELQPGMNLWVDLAGETYKSDDLDHGGDFEADVFYGAFGGDVKVADDYTVGAAFQYGTGTLRSGVSNIKNAIDNYGLTLYGTAKYGSAKILGELAYVWGENDITSSTTAMNGSVDTTMYSAGVTGMYELEAGGFTFVPSIGVRVSRLETDAMQVGAFKVEDQDQTLVQIPIALRINGADMAAGGWKFAPSFKIAYVPTFGDKEIEVRGHETDVIDTNPVQIDFGVRAGTENLLVNAAFAVGAGHNGTSSVGGKVGIKYAF